MRTVIRRLQRLEAAHEPYDRDRELAEQIRAARQQRLGAAYEPPEPFPPGAFDGCYTIAEQMRRMRQLRMQQSESRASLS